MSIIRGTEGNDILTGTTQNDIVYALGGEDSLNTGNGDDFLLGGAGADTLDGGFGRDYINGGQGNDRLEGSGGNDILYGGDGDDTLSAGEGSDALFGEGGNDILNLGPGADLARGGAGADIFVIDSRGGSRTAPTAPTIADFSTGEDAIQITGTIGAIAINLTATTLEELQNNSDPGNGQPLVTIVQGTGDFASDVLIQNAATGQTLAVVKNQTAPVSVIENITEPTPTPIPVVNNAPEDIILSLSDDSIGGIAENSSNGTVIGSFSTTDPDAGDSHSYQLLDNAAGRFAITGNQLIVANGSLLDFETATSHNITVRTTDTGGLTFDKVLTITVTDVNETANNNPTDIALSNSAIAENSANSTAIGSFSTADPDLLDSHSYQLLDNAAGRFAINSNQLIVANGALLDFETATSHNITVRTTDTGGLTFDKVLTIPVTDVNEAIPNSNPTDIALSNSAIAENSSNGTVIGNFSSADPDVGDTHSYSLIDDASGRFAVTGTQLTVANGTLLDFEAATSHNITVRTTDAGGLTFDKVLTIAVANVNEQPTAITLDNNSVAENSTNGTAIATLSTTDPDAGDNHSYALLDTASGRFQIVGNALQVANQTLLDFEANASHNITVRSTDALGLFVDRTFTINLADTPEAPVLDLDGTADEPGGDINFATSFTGNSGSVAIVDAAALTLSDIDSSLLSGTTVRIANLLDGASEVLAATAAGSIAVSYNSTNGELTLSGSDSVANYQQVLRSVTYNNTAASPNLMARTIEFTANDGTANSSTATTTLNIGPNSAPQLDLNGASAGIDFTAAFVQGTGAVPAVDTTSLSVSDANNAVLSSATATIVNLLDGGAEVLAANTSGTNIAANYNSTTGVLTLSGSDSLANYQQVLRTVTYNNTATNPNATNRSIEFKINDGTEDSPTATTTATLITGADLELTNVVSNATPNIGDTLTFTITLTNNNGPVVATNIEVTDFSSFGLSEVAVTASSGSYNSATGVWSLPSLISGNSANLTVSGTVSAWGTIVNRAQVTAVDQADLDSTPNNFNSLEDDQALGLARVALPGAVQLSDVTAGKGGFALDGEAADDVSGYSVSAAGDVNGDGLADLIVGARGADPNGSISGRSYVAFGKTDGTRINLNDITNGTGGFAIDGEAAYDRSGISVSSAGDVNGDGFADLIVGARDADPNSNTDSGRSYVVFGKTNGTKVNLSDITAGIGGFAIDGEGADDQSGFSVSSAGDVNGDGFADLIVGAWRADANGINSGRSYVVFGKTNGTKVNLSDITAEIGGFAIDGEAAGDQSGRSVASAGDVNGDGLTDLIVGALGADPNGSASGRSYVVFGKTDGAKVNLSDITAGIGGFAIDGEAADDRSGFSVAGAGDVNGDGLADLIVGAYKADPNGLDSGRSYVVFGKNNGTKVNLSVINAGVGGFAIDGEGAYDLFANSVAGAGDINGDGLADLIVGAPDSDPNGNSLSGRSYAVFGKTTGTKVNLSTIASGTGGFALDGEADNDRSGTSVATAGDVNGDGFTDLIVGARFADANGGSSGRSYLVFGGDFTQSATQHGTDGSDMLAGTAASDIIIGGFGDDTLGDGNFNDVLLYGGTGDDRLQIGNGNFSRLDGGLGNDTLSLTSAGLILNLTPTTDNTKINGIENIDLTGTGNNTLTLDYGALLNLAAEITASSGFTTLTVIGDAGDVVNANLSSLGFGSSSGGGFTTYTKDNLRLVVDDDITQTGILI